MSQQSKFRNEEPLIREVSAAAGGSGDQENGSLKEGGAPKSVGLAANGNKPTDTPQSDAKATGEAQAAEEHKSTDAVFTGKKPEGIPSLFDHLPKPDFKDVFKSPRNPFAAQVATNAGTTAPASHAGPSEIKEGEDKEKGKSETGSAQKPVAQEGQSLFGGKVSDMFKNPAPPLFGAPAVAKPASTDAPSDKTSATLQQPNPVALGSSLFGNANAQNGAPSLFSNPAPVTGGLFGQGSSLFPSAPIPNIFSNPSSGSVFGKFTFNQAEKNEDSEEEGGEDGEEDPKSESDDEARAANAGQNFNYESPYERILSMKFEDMKVDKKESIGAGVVAIEKLKPAKEEPKEGEDGAKKEDETKAEAPKGVRLEFPLLVVRSRAKVVLGTYTILPKRSVAAFLKSNKACVSLIAFMLEKDEAGAQKLNSYNLKFKFADEKQAEEFKAAFEKLV